MSNQTNCIACDESPGLVSMQSSGLLAKMYSDVTGLTVQVHYTICKACQSELKAFYNFKKRCHDIAGLYEAESVPNQDLSNPKQQLLNEITIVKSEAGFDQFCVDESQGDEDYDYEEANPSTIDDDESITSYSVAPSLTLNSENGHELNDDEVSKPQKLNTINARAEIFFTATEVNERLFSEGYPPVWRLLPKNHVPIPGKIPYSELLCAKISAIMPNKSQVAVHNGFTLFGATTRAYIRCKHSTKMPVSFLQSELKQNQPLRIKIVQKCQECVDEADEQPTTPVPSSSTKSKANFLKHKSILYLPTSIAATFECASKDIHAILNRGYHLCSAEVDPLRKLKEQHFKIETEIVQAWRLHVYKIIGQDEKPRSQINEYKIKKMELNDPFADTVTKETRRAASQREITVTKRQRR
ncbi:hypothetical protein ACKWTF_014129 [Chironomus riparius]